MLRSRRRPKSGTARGGCRPSQLWSPRSRAETAPGASEGRVPSPPHAAGLPRRSRPSWVRRRARASIKSASLSLPMPRVSDPGGARAEIHHRWDRHRTNQWRSWLRRWPPLRSEWRPRASRPTCSGRSLTTDRQRWRASLRSLEASLQCQRRPRSVPWCCSGPTTVRSAPHAPLPRGPD